MYTKIEDVELEDLKKKCTLIHYFGLGFIQIKLGKEYRIHFYTHLLPVIISEEDIHNHRYDFTSKILYGSFHQTLFCLTPGETHTLEEESCQEGYVSEKKKVRRYGIQKLKWQDFKEGDIYSLSHETFHTVSSTNAITLLKRSDYKKELAEVVRPINAPKICPFSKKVLEEELWEKVGTILNKIKVGSYT